MTTTTQRLLDLAAAAPTADGEDLVRLLSEGNALYHQGLEETRQATSMRLGALTTAELVEAAAQAGVPCDSSRTRPEVLLLLALAEWEMTPAAMAYSGMAEDAARRGVSLLPEE
ncbi:hypothetical protein [Streptomyces minutiscleroticus]|nr:hypothetical protein [Streptomyces minutiscleroticus]